MGLKFYVSFKVMKVLSSYVLVIQVHSLRYLSPADTDVFKTSLGRLKKVTTSYDQNGRR